MAHAGQEFCLQSVGALDFLVARLQLLVLDRQLGRVLLTQGAKAVFYRLPLRDVSHRSDDVKRSLNPIWAEADLNRKQRSIFSLPLQFQPGTHGPGIGVSRIR